jgi:hypothetical protein
MMDFIQDGAVGILPEKAAGVGEREFTPIEVFKGGVGFLGHQVAYKRCLA